MSHESTAPTHEGAQEAFQHQAVIEYGSGLQTLRFDTPGDRLAWGEQSRTDPHTDPTTRMILTYESKDGTDGQLGMGEGFIIDKTSRRVFDISKLPEGIPDATVGEPWEIPGIGKIKNVKGLEVAYAYGAFSEADEHVDGDDPFEGLEKAITKAAEVDARRKQLAGKVALGSTGETS